MFSTHSITCGAAPNTCTICSIFITAITLSRLPPTMPAKPLLKNMAACRHSRKHETMWTRCGARSRSPARRGRRPRPLPSPRCPPGPRPSSRPTYRKSSAPTALSATSLDELMKLIAALTVPVSLLLAQNPAPAPLSVIAVRHFILHDATRVAIAVSGPFEFRTDRLHNPERVYYDILNSVPHIITGPRMYSESVDEKLLLGIRVAENTKGVTRVVLELGDNVEPASSTLANPNRLIVELRHASGSTPTSAPTETSASAPPIAIQPTPSTVKPAASLVPATPRPTPPATAPFATTPKTGRLARARHSQAHTACHRTVRHHTVRGQAIPYHAACCQAACCQVHCHRPAGHRTRGNRQRRAPHQFRAELSHSRARPQNQPCRHRPRPRRPR